MFKDVERENMATPREKFSCAKHFRAAAESMTNDRTAHSDCVRAHTSWKRGFDKFKVEGNQVFIKLTPISPEGITYGQYCDWREAMRSGNYLSSSLSVYVSTMERTWDVVECDCLKSPQDNSFSDEPDEIDTNRAAISESFSIANKSNEDGETLLRGLIEASLKWEKRFTEGLGFRISHGQKYLSLLLKHSWINGEIGIPPVSVIDRIILDRASALTGRPWHQPWTQVNDIEEWQSHFDLVSSAANGIPVAAWELIQFELDSATAQRLWFEPIENVNLDNEIETAKKSFMKRFKAVPNDPDWIVIMKKDAIRSALGRNPLYSPEAREPMRAAFREALWRWGIEFLLRWKDLSKSEQTVTRFREEILALRDDMNERFGGYFL